MTKYKLTDQNMQTHNNFQWELDVWKEAIGSPEQGLCSDGWLHYYDSPLLAILHNPIHANINNPRLFECEIDGETKTDKGLKSGCRRMKLVKEISVPVVTTEQRIKYAIYCALEVYKGKSFVGWANDWLSGKDRTAYAAANAAYAAACAATDVAYAAANSAANSAACAADINLIELAEKAVSE